MLNCQLSQKHPLYIYSLYRDYTHIYTYIYSYNFGVLLLPIEVPFSQLYGFHVTPDLIVPLLFHSLHNNSPLFDSFQAVSSYNLPDGSPSNLYVFLNESIFAYSKMCYLAAFIGVKKGVEYNFIEQKVLYKAVKVYL